MDIQLQVTDKELDEFPEESTTFTNIQAMKSQDTHPPTRQLLATQPVGKESLNQSSDPIPLLLSLHIQPDLWAFAQTLLPEALWYLHISIHIGKSLPLNK